jgi:hypothetical protein
MQLTRFDRWLRERYVYETHIQTLRVPESIPKGIRVHQLPEIPGKRFKFLFIVRGSRAADAFIISLREANLMFATAVVDREAWFVRWIAPRNGSPTWILAWIALGGVTGFFGISYLIRLFSDPAIQQMLRESLDTLTK